MLKAKPTRTAGNFTGTIDESSSRQSLHELRAILQAHLMGHPEGQAYTNSTQTEKTYRTVQGCLKNKETGNKGVGHLRTVGYAAQVLSGCSHRP